MKSHFSDESDRCFGITHDKIHDVPTGSVRGKKEGNSPRRETPPTVTKHSEQDSSLSRNASDAKRKRENKGERKVYMTDNLELPSPRKVSKLEGDESPGADEPKIRQASHSERQPLSNLGNI